MVAITKAHYEVLAELRYARQFLRFSEKAAQAAGLTSQQHQAMLAIKGSHGCDRITIGKLAERPQIFPIAPLDRPIAWWRNVMSGGSPIKRIGARSGWC